MTIFLTLVIGLSLSHSTPAAAQDSDGADAKDYCSGKLIKVSPDGRSVSLTKEGQKVYREASRDPKKVEFVRHDEDLSGKETARFGADGRLNSITEVDNVTLMFQSPHWEATYDVAYVGGKCFIKSKRYSPHSDMIPADLGLCRDLKVALNDYKQCSALFTDRVDAIYKKHGANRPLFSKSSNDYLMAAAAGSTISKCEEIPQMKKALNDESFWTADVNAAVGATDSRVR